MSENENPTPSPDETPPTDATNPADSEASDSGTPRRNFVVELMAAAIGGLVGIVPAVLGGLFFLDPLFRKGPKQGDGAAGEGAGDNPVVKDEQGFLRLTLGVDALPPDGTPVRYTVHDDIVNVWNKFPNQPIGSVWLRRIQDQVLAFNTVCPHLGCAVEHRSGEGDFYCPCHTSAFDLEGKPLNVIPPRAMDTLEAEVREGGRIWLKYQEFRGATSEKVPV